ncbi:MAG TPA: hypothetical protein VJH03_14000 [Blastocatellia bacterium]|nr:hypothetical protein [Blastocatellia bacterium]
MFASPRRSLKAALVMVLAVLLGGGLASDSAGRQQSSARLGSEIGHPVPKEVRQDALYKITRNMFSEQIDSSFSFSRASEHVADLVLVEVKDLNPPFVKGSGDTVRESFSLTFRGPTEPLLKQGTYNVSHKELGAFQLFIVPGDPHGKLGPHYEAIINRVYP